MNAVPDRVRHRVAELLGRAPRGDFSVVVSTSDGDPVVIRNAPLLDDGTPMPTRFWLVSPSEIRRIGQLESIGGVNAAERAVDEQELAEAHRRYAAERDAALPPDHAGPRPYGGVGGTRRGVKCLHSHWAWYLAGGDDPVGRWIAQQLETDPSPATRDGSTEKSEPNGSSQSADGRDVGPSIDIGDDATTVCGAAGQKFVIPWGAINLTARWLVDHDPPYAEDLTNALGAVDDYLDDLDRTMPSTFDPPHVGATVTGPGAATVMRSELCETTVPERHTLARRALEELFRDMATQPEIDRRETPGITAGDAHSVVAALSIVLAIARRYRLDTVTFVRPDASNSI